MKVRINDIFSSVPVKRPSKEELEKAKVEWDECLKTGEFIPVASSCNPEDNLDKETIIDHVNKCVYNPQEWNKEKFDEFCKDLKEYSQPTRLGIRIPYGRKDVWEQAALDWINKNK